VLQFAKLIGFYLYSFHFTFFMPRLISAMFRIGCDIYKWHCLETRDGFHPVDNSRDRLETSVDFYPVAHSRHFGVNTRVFRTATSHCQHKNTDQLVTGNQRTTVILKQNIRAVKYIITFALLYVIRN